MSSMMPISVDDQAYGVLQRRQTLLLWCNNNWNIFSLSGIHKLYLNLELHDSAEILNMKLHDSAEDEQWWLFGR